LDYRDFTDDDRDKILIHNNKLHFHQTCRVNYTSYDVRRHQDSINTREHPDFMTLSDDPLPDSDSFSMTSPFWFGRTLKICHVYAKLRGTNEWTRVDFIWARWFQLNDSDAGWSRKRLPSISFIPAYQDDAFGFIDPEHIIRSIHLIPIFSSEKTEDRLYGPSIARHKLVDDDDNNEWEDWDEFYLNMYAIIFH
jgi:hypothetical protein